MRAIDELEENTERLDLLDYEATKARLAEIRKAEEELSGESPENQAPEAGPASQIPGVPWPRRRGVRRRLSARSSSTWTSPSSTPCSSARRSYLTIDSQ